MWRRVHYIDVNMCKTACWLWVVADLSFDVLLCFTTLACMAGPVPQLYILLHGMPDTFALDHLYFRFDKRVNQSMHHITVLRNFTGTNDLDLPVILWINTE